MATVTLLNLRTRAKERANMENSNFVSSSEWNNYINYSISELRDIITSKVGEDYFATSQSNVLTTSQETVALPVDFYKLLWVELLIDGTNYRKIKRFEVAEQPSTAYSLIPPFTELRYRIRADNLWLAPTSATGGRTIRMWYVPLFTALTADADTLVGYNGWEEFVILKSARKALVKEEQDVSDIDNELMVLYRRIESMAPNRDQAEPMRIHDNETRGLYQWL